MTLVHRVLHPEPLESLEAYVTTHGGRGLERARQMQPEEIIALVSASGLRGRGGAGFPTGVKWATVLENRSAVAPTTVVINAAEGEPATFKDRTIVRINPYEVLEGALIATRAVGADSIIVALRSSFATERARLERAIKEMQDAGWFDGVAVVVFGGPEEYLYGEETALLEAIDGRQPFPRIAPPFRRGVFQVVTTESDVDRDTGMSAHVEMAGPDSDEVAPPALVDNVETMANIAKIVWRGSEWFRNLGTEKSPGTVVCTVIGRVNRPGVGEIEMGTTLAEAIELVAGGVRTGHRVQFVLPGASAGVVTPDQLDTPLTYEAMAAIGSGLGSASFAVYDETDDPVACAAGVSRFLFVESCGQCSPCKDDGREISAALDRLAANEATRSEIDHARRRLRTVAHGARCALGRQHEYVVSSFLAAFPDAVEAHLAERAEPTTRTLVTELVDLHDGGAVLDDGFVEKNGDWSTGGEDSGQAPADRLRDRPLDAAEPS